MTEKPTTEGPSEAVVQAWVRLVRSQQTLLAGVEDELKRAGFPPLEWYDVLLELDRAEAGMLQQSELQGRVLLAQYNLCRLLDRLQRDGLVERQQCPVDGRSNRVVITPGGRALRRRMWSTYAAAIASHLGARLSEAEAATLGSLLGKLQ